MRTLFPEGAIEHVLVYWFVPGHLRLEDEEFEDEKSAPVGSAQWVLGRSAANVKTVLIGAGVLVCL